MATIDLTPNNDMFEHVGDGDTVNALAGDDIIILTGSSSEINGQAGADTIEVTGDGNQIDGGADDDVYIITGNDNTIFAGGSSEQVFFTGNGNFISGDVAYAEVEITGDNNTVDVSGLVTVRHFAGSGNVVHNVTSLQSVGAVHDNLITILEKGTINLTGNRNSVVGGFDDDHITVFGNNTSIFSGAGQDYIIVSGNTVEMDAGEDNDLVYFFASNSTAAGGGGDDYIDVGSTGAVADGGLGSDTLSDYGTNNTLVGGDGNDKINLNGVSGVGRGGAGDDFYTVLYTSSDVVELTDEGIDTVRVYADYTIGNNIEIAEAYGYGLKVFGNSKDNTLVDLIGNATLDGGLGADIMKSTGYTTFWVDNPGDRIISTYSAVVHATSSVVNLTEMIGSSQIHALLNTGQEITLGDSYDTVFAGDGDDIIRTGAGLNIIYGGLGNDVIDTRTTGPLTSSGNLVGGVGNDTYIIGDGTSIIFEDADGGYDTAKIATGYFQLYDEGANSNIEEVIGVGLTFQQITGNAQANIITAGDRGGLLYGKDGDDILRGNISQDLIFGDAGDDTIYASSDVGYQQNPYNGQYTFGVSSYDTAYGGEGDDTFHSIGYAYLHGGIGDDVYHVTHEGCYFITEDNDAGIDTVLTSANFNNSLLENVENLIGTSTTAQVLRGNALNNSIKLGIGGGLVFAGDGDDLVEAPDGYVTIFGEAGNDRICIGASYGRLYGGDGNDQLFGGNGENILEGGDGDDRMFAGNTGDILVGGGGNDYMEGGAGGDSLASSSGNDYLVGGDGADTLIGDGGDDFMKGGSGVDNYLGGEGTDTVSFSTELAVKIYLDGTLPNGGAAAGETFRDIEVIGGSNIGDVIYGDFQNNTLFGRGGNDRLKGGYGNDTLAGGVGADTYYYEQSYELGDTIKYFSAADFLEFKGKNFAGLKAGVLNAKHFKSGRTTLASDADDYFIYRTTDDTLWFDPDGKNGDGSALVADFENDFNLKATDILIS